MKTGQGRGPPCSPRQAGGLSQTTVNPGCRGHWIAVAIRAPEDKIQTQSSLGVGVGCCSTRMIEEARPKGPGIWVNLWQLWLISHWHFYPQISALSPRGLSGYVQIPEKRPHLPYAGPPTSQARVSHHASIPRSLAPRISLLCNLQERLVTCLPCPPPQAVDAPRYFLQGGQATHKGSPGALVSRATILCGPFPHPYGACKRIEANGVSSGSSFVPGTVCQKRNAFKQLET